MLVAKSRRNYITYCVQVLLTNKMWSKKWISALEILSFVLVFFHRQASAHYNWVVCTRLAPRLVILTVFCFVNYLVTWLLCRWKKLHIQGCAALRKYWLSMENFLDQFYELTEEIQSMSTCIMEADTISLFTGKFHISNLLGQIFSKWIWRSNDFNFLLDWLSTIGME